MVASMVPDSVHYPMEEYLKAFRGRAFECFSVLYDEVTPGETAGENDDSAPHWAIPILFEPGLVGMDAGNAPGWQDRAFVQAAYGEFLDTVGKLVEFALAARGDQEGT